MAPQLKLEFFSAPNHLQTFQLAPAASVVLDRKIPYEKNGMKQSIQVNLTHLKLLLKNNVLLGPDAAGVTQK